MDSGTMCSSLCSLVLFYPVTKAWADGSSSWKNYAEGYGLDAQLMEAFNAAYIGTGDARQPLVSPGVADDELLKQLPPTLIVNAERDILLCQGKELATRLSGLGVARELYGFASYGASLYHCAGTACGIRGVSSFSRRLSHVRVG